MKFFFVSSGHNSLGPPIPFVTYYAQKKTSPNFFLGGEGTGGIESMIGKIDFTLGPIEKFICFYLFLNTSYI